MNFKKKETILGWLAFLIATATYVLTMEKTGSLWDCGEFLSCTYKLQVAHPPGAPFYMMVGKIFSLLSFGDTTKIAMMINLLSAFSGAFCTYFFFHSASMLMRIFLKTTDEENEGNTGTFILLASFIAANSATFLDSMWFNAIEGEVYAFSIFFTTLNVWAILKWYLDKSETADYWLLLIALCTGMSIGVHLLSLLVFPMMAMLIYYKKFKQSRFGSIFAFLAGVGMIFFVMKLVLSLTSYFLGRMDLLFVNSFGLPFYSGSITGIFLIIGLFYYLIKRSQTHRDIHTFTSNKWVFFILPVLIILKAVMADKFDGLSFLIGLVLFLAIAYYIYVKNNPASLWDETKFKFSANTALLFVAFLFMGYLSNLMVVIRANANPPINMNVPNNFLTMKSYIDREQYGERPLLSGPQYPDVGEVESIEDKSDVYVRNDQTGKYDLVGKNKGYVYPSSVKKLFPRMGHEGDDKKAFYRMWVNPKYEVVDRATGEVVQSFERGQSQEAEQLAAQKNQTGQPNQFVVKDKLTFIDNVMYMLEYQFGFMYFRYLLWNTAGRVDDLQGRVNNDYGRWTSGVNFIDNILAKGFGWGNVGFDQTGKPGVAQKSKSHNTFFMIPFLLCVLGMYYSYKKDKDMFLALFILFFTTGIMQLIQSNEPPVEPRERDYAVAPSFWAFVLWMPFGIYWLFDFLKEKLSVKPAMMFALFVGVAAPILMGTQGWDDHNRGNRTTTLAFAKNMLNACPPNAILFCYGDNDTYPLWYAQEVEGIRPDVRVINTSLIEGDAYISQLRLPMNESKAVNLSIPQEKLRGDLRGYFRFSPNPLSGDTLSLKDIISFMTSDDDRTKVKYQNGLSENFIPTTHAYIDIDPAKAIASKFLITKEKMNQIPSRIYLELPGTMTRGALIQLDVILNNMYERPVCFASSNPSVTGLGIRNYLQNEGMLIKFTPTGSPDPLTGMDAMNSDDMYNMVMKYDFGKIKENNILLDEHTLMSFNSGMKPAIANLAMYYALKGQADTVNRLLDHLYTNIPVSKIPYNYVDMPALQAATIVKNKKYTNLISEGLFQNATVIMDWMTNSNNSKYVSEGMDEVRYNLSTLANMRDVMMRAGDSAFVSRIDQKFKMYEPALKVRLTQ